MNRFYNFQELKTISKMGLSIGLLQGLIGNFSKIIQNPIEIFNAMNYKLIAFIVSYPTIFKV